MFPVTLYFHCLSSWSNEHNNIFFVSLIKLSNFIISFVVVPSLMSMNACNDLALKSVHSLCPNFETRRIHPVDSFEQRFRFLCKARLLETLYNYFTFNTILNYVEVPHHVQQIYNWGLSIPIAFYVVEIRFR